MLDITYITNLFSWLIEPQNRTFIAYWLSSGLIITIWAALAWNERKPFLQQLASKHYWWNSSTRQDYLLIIINSLIFTLLGITWLILTISIANYSFAGLEYGFKPSPFAHIDQSISYVVFAIVLILSDDFSRYALHRLLHWKWFWKIHQLHHSATVLTPLTSLRVHPLEKLLYQLRSSIVYGLCTGIFFFLCGQSAQSWVILGISGSTLLFNLLGANIRHSMIPISYGIFERILISPAQHQLHHSIMHSRTNYGSMFSCWDQLFNSWTKGSETAVLPKAEKNLLRQLLLK